LNVEAASIADEIIESLGPERRPGERVLRARQENLALGIPLDEAT
jgi:hypothetical protein